MRTLQYSLLGTAVMVGLMGCDSDTSTISSTDGTVIPVTLSVSDAPIDDVSEVVVTYSKVAFLPVGEGEPQIFEVYQTDEEGNYVDENGEPLPEGEEPLPMSVNLLDFQGSDAQALVDDEAIPSGDYKLCVFANDGDHPDAPSYVIEELTGNQIPLSVKGEGRCPQGVGEEENAGVLFFNDTFAVNTDNNEFVVEFDLRRGLKTATGQDEGYTIQRTSVELINTATTGNLQGNVALTTYQGCETDTVSGNGYVHAVYLYEENILDVDMGSFAPSETQSPIASANVLTEDEGVTYQYDFGYVEPGEYSVGYTCTANDDSEEGITEGETFGIYTSESGVTVTEDSELSVDL